MLHVKPMIYFENAQEIIPVTYKLKRLTRAAVVATLEHEQYHNPCEVSITYTDNASIHNLNLQYREVNRSLIFYNLIVESFSSYCLCGFFRKV